MQSCATILYMSINEHQFQELLDRYLKGQASEKEEKLLNQFFESYQKDDSENDFHLDPNLKDEILHHIQLRTRTLKPEPEAKPSIPLWLKIAASVSVLLVASYFLIPRKNLSTEEVLQPVALVSEQTSRGVKSIIELPDGTRVHLNSQSSISYAPNFPGNVREVVLTGEAYFDVTHNPDKPFIVRTSGTATQVLGTSFNVKSTNEKIEVTLVNGRVNVTIGDQSSLLEPNQQAVISTSANTIAKKNVDVSKYIGWKDNILYLEGVKLKDAVTTLEQWYNVDINIASPAIKNCVITAKYQNESLENVLNSIEFLLNAKIESNQQKISISGNGCK
jgi:transmembrane sensor